MASLAAAAAALGPRPRVYLDVDIDGWRAAYARATEFVKATNLRYNLTTNVLEDLGGSEKKRVRRDLYPNDFEWCGKGKIVTRRRPERLVFELWPDVAPLACQNFIALATGCKGKIGQCGKPLNYAGCPFHRVVGGFIAQAGDINFGNGSGGESIYNGKKFKDDKGGLKVKIDKRGLLAMGNTGKNSNTSQFFITFAPQPKLTGKHVVFGALVEGEEVLAMIEASAHPDGADEKPTCAVVIAECGVLMPPGADTK